MPGGFLLGREKVSDAERRQPLKHAQVSGRGAGCPERHCLLASEQNEQLQFVPDEGEA